MRVNVHFDFSFINCFRLLNAVTESFCETALKLDYQCSHDNSGHVYLF